MANDLWGLGLVLRYIYIIYYITNIRPIISDSKELDNSLLGLILQTTQKHHTLDCFILHQIKVTAW